LAKADEKLKQTYNIAYIAHTPLEPRAAVAEWKGDEVTVWTGTQTSVWSEERFGARLGIPEDRVRVIVPDTGSGLRRQAFGEAAIEAARLAKSAGQTGEAGLDAAGGVYLGLLSARGRD